ncbi:hypothetical protein [Bradyrhizobium sp. STM 3562]|uniref:hypothetical protein n=1 Tax=Bradyrhizobium sp. STM 3562 TaxID=578924 RepID=UPI0038910AC5
MRRTLSKASSDILFAGMLALGLTNTANAQTVSTTFSVQNSFGAAISLDTANCSPKASISPPFSIANNKTGTFSASATGGTLLCTVRYQNGSNGCQFQIQVNVVGGTTTGFVSASAYKGSGGRPRCGGGPGLNQQTGSFTMQ